MAIDFKILVNLVFFFSIFPFLGFLPTDLEPFYLILIFISVLFYLSLGSIIHLSKPQISFILLLLFSTLYAIRLDQSIQEVFRTIIFFLTPILFLVFFKISAINQSAVIKWCRFGLFIYLIFGILEYFGFNFLESLLPERPRLSRGVRSLSSEPSMYGFVCLILYAIISLLEKKTFADLVILIFNLLLSGSASVLVVAIPCILVILLQNGFQFKSLITLFIIALFIPILITQRVLDLFQIGIFEILTDQSINERIGHIFYVVSNPSFFITGGDNSFGHSYFSFMNQSQYFFYGSKINNILSGFGQLIYDAGILGCMIFFLIMNKLWKFNIGIGQKLIPTIIFLGAFIQTVGLANPMLSMLIVIPFAQLKAQDTKLSA